MEDFNLVRCDSLDAGSRSDRDMMTPTDQMSFDSEGSDPAANLGPSPAELAQCEAEMGTLLSIIAELNKKMGSLKAPSEPGDLRAATPSRPLVPDLLSHRLSHSSPERNNASAFTSKPAPSGRGGGSVMWTKLQEVLSSVEDSISSKRSWAAPITASDQVKHREHLRAAQESRVKAAQILEDMEREFGISCSSAPLKEQFAGDVMECQDEVERQQSLISPGPEERKTAGFPKSWRSGSRSPSYWATPGAFSPDWASPPFPGSPLLHRRAARAVAPLCVGGDCPPLGSLPPFSPTSSPISLDSETERLSRCIERLRAKNEQLTAALERKKAESEQMSAAMSRLEADCSALQAALRHSEECEESYSELLSLYDAKEQQSVPPQTLSAEADSDGQQPDRSSALLGNMGTEELSTSFSTAGVTEETQTSSHTGHSPLTVHRPLSTPEQTEREVALRQKIEHLKRNKAAIRLPKSSSAAENETAPKSRGTTAKDRSWGPDGKKEKTSLLYEFISVRGEMSDLRALIRLKEKELRCLEWGLMAQKAQEVAGGGLVAENLREELDDCKSEQQRLCDSAAKLGSAGDIAGTKPILKELQAVLQREQALKKRLTLVQDSLNTALSDSSSSRRDNGEQIARLTQAHSKALSSYRQIRRKYREQVWRLEQKVAAMAESQQQNEAHRVAGDASEWRREETVL